MRAPPAGALAVDDHPYPFTPDQGELAAVRISRLSATRENIAHGKWVFENVCITCHGPQAAGDGHLTKLFPAPPSLMSQKVRDWSDGRIFHVPMRGQGSMPSHASIVSSDQIWAVVLYIRNLQDRLPVASPTAGAPAAPTEGGQP
jgi:mono/diheme cytochrome c family protein